ncbi:MAG: hypothetical protein NTU53_01335 [Planctomycetota bacterium]|nr:hypothetical protein [Planctomycetota bacterium]
MWNTANLGNVESSDGGWIMLMGEVINTGNTVTAKDGTDIRLDCNLTGGTLATIGTGQFHIMRYPRYLTDVTLAGTLQLTSENEGYPASARIKGSLNLDDATVVLLGPTGRLYGNVSATPVTGSGTILFQGDPATPDDSKSGVQGLDLGPGITARTGQRGGTLSGVINRGQVFSQTPGQKLTLTSVDNHGTVEASNGGLLRLSSLVNNGVVAIDGTTANIDGTWTNANGTIRASNGATINALTSPTDLGSLQLACSAIYLAGKWTASQISGISAVQSTLILTSGNSELDNSNGNLVIGPGTELRLAGSAIRGGTVSGAEGARLAVPTKNTANLYGVTLTLPTTIEDGASLRASDMLKLDGGRISLVNTASAATTLEVLAPSVSGNGQIVFDGIASANRLSFPTSLTIEAGITIRTGAAGGTIGSDASKALVSQGTISAQTPGQTITVRCGANSITNQGLMQAANGSSLNIYNLTTSGALSASSGGTINLYGTFANTGSVNVNDGTVNLFASFALDSLRNITQSGPNAAIVLQTSVALG